MDVYNCDDVDECGGVTCTNGECKNTAGSFHCECLAGFEIPSNATSELICEDIDECALGAFSCIEGFDCINAIGTYSCALNALRKTNVETTTSTTTSTTTTSTTTSFNPNDMCETNQLLCIKCIKDRVYGVVQECTYWMFFSGYYFFYTE